ncbi:hypothetical protein GCM10009415_41730 [Chitinophaga japonensis]
MMLIFIETQFSPFNNILMKTLTLACTLLLFLFTGSSFTGIPAPAENVNTAARARIHATLRLSQVVAGIEVTIPTAIYSVQNQQTGAYGTAIDPNRFDVEVQEGDVLYLNSFDLPLAIYYTVTAADVASGSIHVSILSL